MRYCARCGRKLTDGALRVEAGALFYHPKCYDELKKAQAQSQNPYGVYHLRLVAPTGVLK